MTPQTEAVDLLAFDNSYARLPDKFFARLRRFRTVRKAIASTAKPLSVSSRLP